MRFTFFDDIKAGLIGGVVGIGIGTAVTAYFAKLILDGKIEEEQRRRNLIPNDELKGDDFDVDADFRTQLESFFVVIENGFSAEGTIFRQGVIEYALPKVSAKDPSKMSVPHLAGHIGNQPKGSGVGLAVLQLFSAYHDAKGDKIDVYLAMTQILENIIILYRQFLAEAIRIPGETQAKNLLAVTQAMERFLNDLKASQMFGHRGFAYSELLSESKRSALLKQLAPTIADMNKEAIQKQKTITILEQSQRKQEAILEAMTHMGEFVERTAEKDIFDLVDSNNYTMYARKDRLIRYNFGFLGNELSDEGEMVFQVIRKHMRNAYDTFYQRNNEKRESGYPYLKYLLEVTNENQKDVYNGSISKPSIAEFTTDTFPEKLSDEAIDDNIVPINAYFKYLNVAAAMQADLTQRLDAQLRKGAMPAGEFDFRRKLVDLFLDRAQSIASTELFGDKKYFKMFMERTSDGEFIKEAKKAFFQKISTADQKRNFQSSQNDTFQVPTNNYAHGEALTRATAELEKIDRINEEWDQQSLETNERDIQSSDDSATNYFELSAEDREFIYYAVLACQDDKALQDTMRQQFSGSTEPHATALINTLNRIEKIKEKLASSLQWKLEITEKSTVPRGHTSGMGLGMMPIAGSGAANTTYSVNFGKTRYQINQKEMEYIQVAIESDQFCKYFTNTESQPAERPYFRNIEELNCLAEALEQFSDYLATEFNESHEYSSGYCSLVDAINETLEDLKEIDRSPERRLAVEREKLTLGYQHRLDAIQAQHEIMTQSLTAQLERYQSGVALVFNKVIRDSTEQFERLVTSAQENQKTYKQLIENQGEEAKTTVDDAFSKMNSQISDLSTQQTTLFGIVGEVLSLAKESEDGLVKLAKAFDDNKTLQQEAIEAADDMASASDGSSSLTEQMLQNTDTLLVKFKGFFGTMETLSQNIVTTNQRVCEELATMRQDLEAKIERLNTEKTALETAKTKIEAEKTEAENNNKELEEYKNRTTESLDEANKNNEALSQNIGALQKDLVDEKRKIEKVGRKLEELNALVIELSSVTLDQEYLDKRKKLEDQILSSKDSIDPTDKEVSNLYAQYKEIERTLEGKIYLVQQVGVRIASKLNEVISENTGVASSNQDAQLRVDQALLTLEDQKSVITQLRRNIDNLQMRLAISQEGQITALKGQIKALEMQLNLTDQHKTELEQQSNKTKALEGQIQSSAQNELANAQNECTRLINDCKKLEQENAVIKEKYEVNEEKLKESTKKYEAKKEALKSKKVEHSVLQKENQEGKEQLKTLTDAYQQEKSNLESQVSELEQNAQKIQQETQEKIEQNSRQLQTETTAIQEKADREIEAAQATLQTTKQECQAELDRKGTEFSNALEKELGKMYDAIAIKEAEVYKEVHRQGIFDEIQARRDDAKSIVTSLEEKLGTHYQTACIGAKKYRWFSAALTILQNDQTEHEAFFITFKALMIILMQKRIDRWSQTDGGKKARQLINDRKQTDLRESLFGTKDKLSYKELAGKLLSENTSVGEAKRLMKRDDITIEKFKEVPNQAPLPNLISMFAKQQQQVDDTISLFEQTNQALKT